MDLNVFKANFRNGGARQNLFRITITNPVDGSSDLVMPFRAKGTSLPTSSLAQIEVPYMGRKIKVAGVKSYEDWNVTVMEDEDFSIRNALESWQASINSPETNTRGLGTSEMSAYKSTGIIEQLSQTGVTIRTYKFIGMFPTIVASVPLSWDNDAIQEFEVSFAYDYWIVESGLTGDAGGL